MDAALRPAGDGYADEAQRYAIWQRAVQADFKLRRDDPAAYVARHSDGVRSAFAAAAGDPAKLPQALALSEQMQAQIGVPEADRRLLTERQVAGLVQQFATAPPEKAADLVEGMAAQYGSYWPRVFGELVRAKLPPSAMVLATMSRPLQAQARTALVDAMAHKDDLKKTLGAEAVKGIEDAARSELADFLGTFKTPDGGFMPGSLTTTAAALDGVQTLAMAYAAFMSPAAAAKKAARDVVNDYYTFQDGYRVPVEHDADAVEMRSRAALEALSPDKIQPLGTMFQNVPDENRRQSAYDAAMRGRWVTNHDESGLLRLNGHGQPVVLADGSFLTLPFAAPDGYKAPPKLPSGNRLLLGAPAFVPDTVGDFLRLPKRPAS